jgi:acyl-coenzyme A synthetase/AMP-(fatty) acid ligase
MQGYWRDVETIAEVFGMNVYHTGDFGYRDKDGYFYVSGRKDNLLKVKGHRVNLQEIEDVLMETDLVVEASVFGIPDELMEYKLVAAVTPINEDCREDEILSICAEKLPRFKLPEKLNLVRALPKRMNGKIDRKKCLELMRKPSV